VFFTRSIVNYPDLSAQKHIDFLRHLLTNNCIDTVRIINDGSGKEHAVIPSYYELMEKDDKNKE
jgi:hypothetical protein